MQTNMNQSNELGKNSYQNFPSAPPAPTSAPFTENHFIINLEEDQIDSYIG